MTTRPAQFDVNPEDYDEDGIPRQTPADANAFARVPRADLDATRRALIPLD
jgi:hypothetical protein